tara:strand:+ start:93 stop:314 length:222 start_codon:yes stop_codon:yes gene_type:complete
LATASRLCAVASVTLASIAVKLCDGHQLSGISHTDFWDNTEYLCPLSEIPLYGIRLFVQLDKNLSDDRETLCE